LAVRFVYFARLRFLKRASAEHRAGSALHLDMHAFVRALGSHTQANAGEGRKFKAALALCFPRIPSSLLLEPVFVFTLVRIAYVPDVRLHTYQVLYEVILPHLLQSRSFTEAYDHAQCVFERIPLDSIHSWERVLCHTAFRHMLRRNGVTEGEIKVLWLGIREEIFTRFCNADVPSAHTRYVTTEARRAMCAAAARALGKQLISLDKAAAVAALAEQQSLPEHLSAEEEWPQSIEGPPPAATVIELKRRAVKESSLTRIVARKLPLAARDAPRLDGVAEMVANEPDALGGSESPAVDAAGCLRVLRDAVRSCDQIRSGGLDTVNEALSVVLDAFQIVDLIVKVCCEKMPAPSASADFSSESPQELLQLLYKTAVHLMAAGNTALTVSWMQNKEVGASLAVCCGALFAWADAIVRGSDMATAQHLRSFQGKVCPWSFGGSDLANVTSLLHPTPPMLKLRRQVLCYWEAVEGEDPTLLWDWRGLDNCVELTDGIASIPTVDFALQFVPSAEDEAERILSGATLLVSAWEAAPEMAVLRDMSVLAAFSLHKADWQSKQSNGGRWLDLEALIPSWSLKQTGGTVQLRLRMLRNYSRGLQDISPDSIRKYATWTTRTLIGLNYDWRGGPLADPKDGAQYTGIDVRGQITEHSLLFGIPPGFGQQLGSDEAEMLMSTLLVPYLRLPVFLRFISDGRASALGNTAFRSLFEDVTAEPGPWVSTRHVKLPTTVPAHVKVQDGQTSVRKGGDAGVVLGSTSGYLAEEVRLDPVGVASMVTSIVDRLAELFSGGEITFFAQELFGSESMDPDSALDVPSSIQGGLLYGLSLSARVECLAASTENPGGEKTAEAITICSAARQQATRLIEAKVEETLVGNAGAVSLAILQVVASTLSAWRWASKEDICAKAGVLLGWCSMIRVWLTQAVTAGTEVSEMVLPSICMHGWADAVSHIGAHVSAMLVSADTCERDEVLDKVAATALSGNCPDLAGRSWEPCGSFQWNLGGVRISTLTAVVCVDGERYSTIPNVVKRHSMFAEVFCHATPTECTILKHSKEDTVVKVWSDASEFVVQACPPCQTSDSQEAPVPHVVGAAEVAYDGDVWRPSAPIEIVSERVNIQADELLWFKPIGDLLREHERLIKADGKWLMLRISSAELFTVYELHERCGELHEMAVFTSNDRWCTSSLPLPLEGTSLDRFPVGKRFEHPCELGRNAAVVDQCPSEDVDLAVFRRRGGDNWDRFIPKWKLRSLLPAALIDAYQFWQQDGNDELCGVGLASAASISVDLRTAAVTRTLRGSKSHLLCVADAEAGTPWARLAETLMHVESLAHVLVWSQRDSEQQLLPVLVELPRLRTELRPRTDQAGCTRLHLKEDPALFVAGVAWGCKQQPHLPERYLPWQLPLSDGETRTVLLVPNVRPCPRGKHPATRALDYDDGGKARADAVVRPFYLYPVAQACVVASGRAAALYLFVIRLHQCQFEMAIGLVNECATTMPYSLEEEWVASLIATTMVDTSASAAACRLSMFEALLQNGTAVRSSWNVRDDAWRYLQGHLRVASPCLLDAEAERIALEGVAERSRATHGLHRRCPTPGSKDAPEPIGRALHLVNTRIGVLSGTPESALPPPIPWSAGGGWRRLEAGLAGSLRECLEDFTKDGDCWQDKLAAPAVAVAQDGGALCELYDAILTPGPAAGAPAAFLSLCAARSGELPVGLAGTSTGGASFVDLAARWVYLISQPIQEKDVPIKLDHKPLYRFKREDKWVSLYRNALGGYDEVQDGEIPPTIEIKRSRTPWPRECTLLLCALSALPKPVYPPAKTALGAVSLKALTNRKKGPIFNWAWAFIHAAFTAVSSAQWMERTAPSGQRTQWGVCSSGGYGSATVSQRTFSVEDTLQVSRRCTGACRHPLHDALAAWMPPEAKPPSPQHGAGSKLPFQVNLDRGEMATPEAAQKLARLESSLVAFRKTARLETVPSVFQQSLVGDTSAASAHLVHVIDILMQLKDSGTEEYRQVLYDLHACNAARSEGLTVQGVSRKLMELAGIAPKVKLEYVARALASTKGEQDLQAAFPGLDATAALNLTAKGLFLQSQQLQTSRALSHAFTMRAMLTAEAVDPVEVRQVAARLTAELGSQIYHAKASDGVAYDPRMLLFENCASITLRASQVSLLQEISAQVRGGDSRVHQMIMGEGKTTVVTPLLVLMWSSQCLMTITVPSALLAMVHSCLLVLSKLQKRTVAVSYTRVCPDGTDALTRAQTLCTTLQRARTSESAVLSTPQTLKSIILHFIEMQAQLCGGLPATDDMPDQHSADWSTVFAPHIRFAAIRDELQKCLALWSRGLLIMDEADVIFHPLKSELLFPVGNVLDVALTKPRIRGTIHLLSAVLDGACPALDVKLGEAMNAREMAHTPHLLLVDRAGYDRFVPHLAVWMWEWLEEELKATNAQLLRREPVNMKASSVLDAEHGPENAVGGETTGSEPSRGDGYRGVGFWCSAESPGSCEFSFEVSPPAKLRTLRVQYKAVSSWPGRSGQVMIPSDTVVELSADGGTTFPLSVRVPRLHGDGEHDGVQLPNAPETTHVRLRLSGLAPWFAIRDIFFMVEQDASSTTRIDKDVAIAYLADRQSTMVDSAVPFVRDLMRMAHNLIHSLLPHALSKVYRVDYGLIEEGDKVQVEPSSEESLLPPRRLLTAVPFVGKDSPSPTAEFAHPDVIILLTFLSYRYAGLRKTDTAVLVHWMKDAQAIEGGPARLRPTGILFQRWLENAGGTTTVGGAASGKVRLPLSMVDMGDSWQAEAIHASLKHNHSAHSHYLSEIVLPNCLTYHESRLGATGEELGDSAVFGQRLAYTGTPNALLPKAMGDCCYEELADGRMLDTLSSPECVQYEQVAGEWDVVSLLMSIATHDPPFCALIDPGALIVGMSNMDVAQALLDCGLAKAGMQGVVFLDSNDHRMILLLDGRVVPLEEAGVALHLRFTFFDQLHTCGMDIVQPPMGRAAVLIGKDMRLRDYTQACWRMRGIGAGQTIHTMIVDEVSRLVAQVSQTENPAADVLAWLTANEILSERLQGLRLKELHLRTEKRRPAFEMLMQKEGEGSIEAKHVQPYLADQLQQRQELTVATMASREMDAEVEVEKEMEVQNANVWKKPYTQHWEGFSFNEEPWPLDALETEGPVAQQFWALNEFTPERGVSPLPFKSTVMVSRNHSWPTEEHHTVQMQRGGASSRVKNVLCALVWEWQGGGATDAPPVPSGMRRGVAAVSLAEAETLRWLLHHAPDTLGPEHLTLSLWDVTTGARLGGDPQSTAAGPTLEEAGALRLFNCDVWLDAATVQHALTQTLLTSVRASDVSLWMYHMMVLRRRDWKMAPRAFESSPIGRALDLDSE
jgi:hypothetical protein